MGGPRYKPVLKDASGIIHLRMPNSRSAYPWCAKNLSLRATFQRYQKKRLRLVKWVEPDEVVNCVRCTLISLEPGEYSDHFL